MTVGGQSPPFLQAIIDLIANEASGEAGSLQGVEGASCASARAIGSCPSSVTDDGKNLVQVVVTLSPVSPVLPAGYHQATLRHIRSRKEDAETAARYAEITVR